jgi:hypothetical protein
MSSPARVAGRVTGLTVSWRLTRRRPVAQPGDTFLLHAGFYGARLTFYVPGTSAAYIAWKAAGDGEVTLPGIDIYAVTCGSRG